jgi:hypothetical protein
MHREFENLTWTTNNNSSLQTTDNSNRKQSGRWMATEKGSERKRETNRCREPEGKET